MDVILGVFVVTSLWISVCQATAIARANIKPEGQTVFSRIWISLFKWMDCDLIEEEEVKDPLVYSFCWNKHL